MYNFKEREQYWRDFWEKENIYLFNEKSKKPFYSVDTPPPYVSADHLHQGHIMSYSQAEFIVRYKRMKGFEVYYPMGFDDNGLPTERFVEKKYKLNKKNTKRKDFIKKCLEETKKGSLIYKNLWKLLGISVDWTKTYSTINKNSQKISQWSFLDLYKKKKVYRAKKPIMWCTACQTAISQADLEDEEKETYLVFIKAKTKQGKEIIFSTTRPELLPSCVGISVHPKDKRYKDLVGKKIIIPITNKEIEMTSDEMVDPNFGTGIVYFCSSGDRQFLDWEQNHPIKDKIYLLNYNGTMNEKAGEYRGLTVLETRKRIVEDLEKIGCIEKKEKITHSVNTHERCGTDVEYIDSEQWFIDILNIKKELLLQADKMNWFPISMKQKYIDWVSTLKWDWCISRQRYYGVPIPVWYCPKCSKMVIAQEKELPVDPTETEKICSCGSKMLPEKDVLDTWATSSLTPNIANNLTKAKLYPLSLRPQAFEIIRTWLFYTVVKSFYHFNSVPFKDIMISGHGLDEKGKKLSKRLGNYVPPEEIIEQYGADALRYWACGASLGNNLRYSEEEVKKGKKTVTKLFNAANFCFLHFKNKDYSKIENDLETEDKWILYNLSETIKKTTQYFEQYAYSKAKDEIDNFFWNYFTSNYLEFVKYRLYENNDEVVKKVLYKCLLSVIKLYAPLIPFITEEIYQEYFVNFEKEKSIHLSEWPKELKIEFKEKNEFQKVINTITEIRTYKSNKGISLGKEIEEFKTKADKQYNDFIGRVGKVKKIK